jgi:NAD(P)-dependent dehydrogenase (short-subunit alcohol dehydrogenase family)
MDLELRGKVALVTGAGKGMGLAAAKAFAAEAAKIVVAEVDQSLAGTVARTLRSQGGEALAIRCDVSVEADVKAMVEQTVATFGSLDAAFNNAGVQSPAIETADADSAVSWV